jgi:hypothetical protein
MHITFLSENLKGINRLGVLSISRRMMSELNLET